MFERFTERARQVVVLAQDESRRLGHDRIGTEHILLGLLREEEGIAARVLETLDVTLDKVRAEVEGIIGAAKRPRPARSRSRTAGSGRSSSPDRQSFDEAASLRDAEHRLRVAAAELVRAWRRHIDTSP